MSDLDTSSHHSLSPDGAARRDAMLGELTQSMEVLRNRRRRRRRVAQSVGVVTVLVTCAWLVTLQVGSPSATRHNEVATTDDLSDAAAPTTEPRLVIRPVQRTGLIQEIDDAALLTLLARIDRPTGIVRSGGRTWLTAAVTDAELEAATDEPAPTPSGSPTL